MRWGYSTGTCAAAAGKAALQRLLADGDIDQVSILLPSGNRAAIPVASSQLVEGSDTAVAEIIKDGGDDPDATNGMVIAAQVTLLDHPEIIVEGGPGVGRVTKPGLAVAVGGPAINPVPLAMIRTAVGELLPPGRGVRVVISAPEGERVARKTMNARLGITGGISILGTSGLVRPMSQEAYLDSLIPQIDQALALGHGHIVLTPGGLGARMAQEQNIPEEAIVQTSNFIGLMLDGCAQRRIQGVVLFGHVGKLIKVAGGIFNTHSQVADARREILAAHTALIGGGTQLIARIMQLNTIDEAPALLREYGLERVWDAIAAAASERCQLRIGDGFKVGTVLYTLDGTILAYDREAAQLGRQMAWRLP